MSALLASFNPVVSKLSLDRIYVGLTGIYVRPYIKVIWGGAGVVLKVNPTCCYEQADFRPGLNDIRGPFHQCTLVCKWC